jgi:predicted acetyltransferase
MTHCFNQFKGKWEVMVIPGNDGAYKFWKSVIGTYTNEKFSEKSVNVPHFNNSDSPHRTRP